jgi:putative ABC transport system permease protein
VLINEEAVKVFGLDDPQKAIGQSLWLNDSTKIQVAGVLKDFQFQSFLHPIAPLLFRYQPDEFNYLNLKITAGTSDRILPVLASIWKQANPYSPFTAAWFDQQLYEKNFQYEDQLFIGMLTAMALTIACLGLLGIVMYTTQTRTKEIGIRKVMGANVLQLVNLMSRDFMVLLLIAGAIGLPAGYQVSHLFLQQYTYHITIDYGLLLLCFSILFLLGGLAIGSQTIKAALTNPVESLRND